MGPLTVSLDVTAAPLQHAGHLPVDGVEAQLGLGPSLRGARLLQLQLGRVRELQRLQQARLTLHEVGDGVHRQAALMGDEGNIDHSSLTNHKLVQLRCRPLVAGCS